ncbi:MAG TPA: AgmX/PglI C-terminal domain-containing protein [Deltaproteobacteria bacterium]|nr:AgmX/PglI C-terminal domain-containing protein [Deltaproteobacteria bacterium]
MLNRISLLACLLSLSCLQRPECSCETAKAAPPLPTLAAAAVVEEAPQEPPSDEGTAEAGSRTPGTVVEASPMLSKLAGRTTGRDALSDTISTTVLRSAPEPRVAPSSAPRVSAHRATEIPRVTTAKAMPTTRTQATSGTSSLSIQTTVKRGLSRDQIRERTQASMGQVRACYERALKSNPRLRGRIVASWRIEASGEVSRPRITRDEIGDEGLQSCVIGAIGGWGYPSSGKSTTVEFPFVLQPGR